MRILVLSDLHNEFQPFTPAAVEADVVVLAGDIDIKARGVVWALNAFKGPVVMVPGNHEYYKGSLGHTWNKMKDLAAGTHVHLLNDNSAVIDGVRFLGATLWTDYRVTGNQPLAEWDARQRLSDFKQVRDEQFRRVHTTQLLTRHQNSRNFLSEQLDTSFNGPTVVVTHHAPSELSLAARYLEKAGDHLNASYASRLDHLMGSERVAVWIHGHVHDSMDYDLYGTRVVCNPRGYAPEHLNPNFDATKVVEV